MEGLSPELANAGGVVGILIGLAFLVKVLLPVIKELKSPGVVQTEIRRDHSDVIQTDRLGERIMGRLDQIDDRIRVVHSDLRAQQRLVEELNKRERTRGHS